VGGGSGVIHPGAASLAHMGILLLDLTELASPCACRSGESGRAA
jgi:magnesium chelatase subunit ChlI-like protein